MTVLYVVEQGARLERHRGRLRVMKGDRVLTEVPLEGLAQVLAFGHVTPTGPAIRALLANGADMVFLTAGGSFLGRLSNGRSGNVTLRQTQYRRLAEPEAALELARGLVTSKLRNQRRLLLRRQRRGPDDVVARAATAMRAALARSEDARELDVLRGYEGAAAAAYFEGFGRCIQAPDMGFTHRRRRPPPDPVNVLLSFGYTVLGNLAHGFIEEVGLDPYMGALHEARDGRPSLVLDLIEPFRAPVIDTAVLRAVNTRAITPADFAWPADGEDEPPADDDGEEDPAARRLVFLPVGVRKWVAEVERRLGERVLDVAAGKRLTYRQLIREQAYALARHLRGEQAFVAFDAPP